MTAAPAISPEGAGAMLAMREKERWIMAVLPIKNRGESLVELEANAARLTREVDRRKQVVSVVLLVISIFQIINLPGAILMHSTMAIGTVVLGLILCGFAALFNRLGQLTVVSLLLIAVVDLGRREVEQRAQLDTGVEYLSQILIRAANGERSVRAQLGQDDQLWRVSNSLNLLLTRLWRTGQIEQENKQLRGEVSRLTEALHIARTMSQRRTQAPS